MNERKCIEAKGPLVTISCYVRSAGLMLAGIAVSICWIDAAVACVSMGLQGFSLLPEIPIDPSKKFASARVTVEDIASSKYPTYAIVRVVEDFGGLVEGETIVVIVQRTMCDQSVTADMIGKDFFVGGNVYRRPGRRPVFEGRWRWDYHSLLRPRFSVDHLRTMCRTDL